MPVEPRDCTRSVRDAPRRRVTAELYCLVLSMLPHEGNHKIRTLGTLAIVVTWALIETGAAFGLAELPSQFFFLRLVVGVVVGRMWGIEINNVAGVQFSYSEDDEEDNGDN